MALPFTVVDAFTNKAFCGNPAAVIVLPSDHRYPDSILQSIALEFNLSETAFVTAKPYSKANLTSDYVSFGLRWFTPTDEVKLCGHATLGSALVLYADPGLVSDHINEIRFSTLSGTLVTRRIAGSSKIELEFPVGNIVPADEETMLDASAMIRKATGIQDLVVHFVGICDAAPYNAYLLIEIDPSIHLSSLKVDPGLLVRTRTQEGGTSRLDAHVQGSTTRPITVISNQKEGSTNDAGMGFNVRVFASLLGIPEDPVTGSASSFAAKYWAARANVGPGRVMEVSQVSHRGGELEVIWEEPSGTVKLRGNGRVASRGEIYL